MNQQEATQFVIRELGKLRPRNDIVQKVCESTNMDWGQAEKFIQSIEAEHGRAIAKKQSPLVAVIGLGTVIAGFALSGWILYETLNGIIIFFLSFPVPWLGNITYFLIGAAMIAGGLHGTWDTITRIWNS